MSEANQSAPIVWNRQPIRRRTFLRLTGLAAGFVALSRVRLPVSVLAVQEVAGPSLRVLAAGDARILAAIAERITDTGDPDMPRFSQTAGLRIIDTALLNVGEEIRGQLHWGLLLFQYMPPLLIGRLSTFTDLSTADQESYLRCWANSRWKTLRTGFEAFRNLAMLGYYADERSWAGIHYDGPWVPRPRRL